MGHKIRCYQIKEWTWRPSETKTAIVQETHEDIGQRGAQPSGGVRPERSGVPQACLISKASWSCAMQQGKMQSFILTPGWGLADVLFSFPRTADTQEPHLRCRISMLCLPIFWRNKEASTNLVMLPSPCFLGGQNDTQGREHTEHSRHITPGHRAQWALELRPVSSFPSLYNAEWWENHWKDTSGEHTPS